jgi:hypothetical protein
MTMAKWIASGVVVAIAFAGGMLWAQPKNVQPPAQVISGADFGFRVDSMSADGTPQGRIVVRQNGQWVEVSITGGVRRLGLK